MVYHRIFLIQGKLLYNVMLLSTVQECESVGFFKIILISYC